MCSPVSLSLYGLCTECSFSTGAYSSVCAGPSARALYSARRILGADESWPRTDLFHCGVESEGELLLQALYSLDQPKDQADLCEEVSVLSAIAPVFVFACSERILIAFRNAFEFAHITAWDRAYLDHKGPQVLFATPGMLHAGTIIMSFLWFLCLVSFSNFVIMLFLSIL